MPPTPRRKAPSCVEILDRLGDGASWDEFLAGVAAASEIENGIDVPAEAPPAGRDGGLSDADQIAELQHRLGLD